MKNNVYEAAFLIGRELLKKHGITRVDDGVQEGGVWINVEREGERFEQIEVL